MTHANDLTVDNRSQDEPAPDDRSPKEGSGARPGEGSDDPAAGGPGRVRSWGWVPWLLVVVLAGLVAWVWLGELRPLQQAEARRTAVEDAALNFLSQLTNWDASDGMADTQDALLALGTEGFASEVGNVFSTVEDLVTLEARSTATIEDLFVQSIEDDTATVFGVVEQTITTNAQAEPSAVQRSFRARFVASDGGWLVQRLELVAEQQVSGGPPDVPGLDEPPGSETVSPGPTPSSTATAPGSSAAETATGNNAGGEPSQEGSP